MTAVLIIVGAFAGVAAGKIWERASRHVTLVRPGGYLWGWMEPHGCGQMVLSTGLSHGSEYIDLVFPTEAQAAAELKDYLASTLHQGTTQRLSAGLGEHLDEDLIVIGGAVNNAIARRVLALPTVPFHFENHTIVDDESGKRWSAKLETRDGHRQVVVDYCLIVRTTNPFNDRRGAFLIAGSRAYGTLGGARAVSGSHAATTVDALKGTGQLKGTDEHFAAIIKVEVHNGVPGAPEVVEARALDAVSARHPTEDADSNTD